MAFKLDALKEGKVGAGLLSEVSNEEIIKKMEIEWVRLDQARPSKKNKYHITDEEVQELKQSIIIMGLSQPLECRRVADDEFVIISGETRYRALSELYAEGKWGDSFPTIIKDPKAIELPLSEESKEMLAIMEPNSKARKYTDMDLLNEIDDYDKIYTELKNNGCLEYEGQQIKGRRNRELIASRMGMSERQVAKVVKVNKVAIKDVKKAVEDGRANIHIAEAIASLSEEEQQELIQGTATKEKIEIADVQTFTKQKRLERDQESKNSNTKHMVTIEDFNTDLERIKSGLKKSGGAKLNKKQYENYKNLMSRLDKVLTF